MNIFFLIASFNAFFFALLSLKKKRSAHDNILTAWLIYLGLYTGLYALFNETLFVDHNLLSGSLISLLLLNGPFLYTYINALLGKPLRLKSRSILHFLPFVLFNAYLLTISFFPEEASHIRWEHTAHAAGTPWLFNAFLLMVVLSGPFYFVLSIRRLKQWNIDIFNHYSTHEHINLDWLRKLVYAFGVIWTILMMAATVHHVFHLFSWVFCTHGLTLSLSLFVILIGYFGLGQQAVQLPVPVSNEVRDADVKVSYSNVFLKKEDVDVYVTRLNHYMADEKPFLDPMLTLPDLASRLDMPAHHLSRVINEQFGKNFFDYINQFRVEEVKVRMTNPAYAHLSLLGIAFDCGFNTKSTFNRVFKNATGYTPSAYRDKV